MTRLFRYPVVPVYVLRLFYKNAALVIGAMAGLMIVFDLLSSAEDITANNSSIIKPLAYYLWLRLPLIISLVMPLGVLLAAMITFIKLAGTQEITALQGAGLSMYRIALIVVGGTFILSLGQFALMNTAGVNSVYLLGQWEDNDFAGLPTDTPESEAPPWFTAGDFLVHTSAPVSGTQGLDDIVIIRRDDTDMMTDYYSAAKARYDNGRWNLADVYHKNIRTGEEQNIARAHIDLEITPARFHAFSKPVEALSISELWQMSRNNTGASRPPYYYSVWLNHKLAAPLGSLIMVLIAAPLGMMLSRRSHIARNAALVVFSGFLFFIMEKVLLTLGENGQLPVMLSAWAPLCIFGLLSTSALLHKQS